MKRSKVILIISILMLPLFYTYAQVEDISKLKAAYEEIRQVLAKDNGKMWGTGIYGALMFVDPETKNIVSNEQAPDKSLIEKEGLFIGTLDETMNIANTALNWKGKNWTMVMLPLPKNMDVKRPLIIHELFHNVQEKLKLNIYTGMPNHLEKKTARVLLRLEWNALMAALTGDNLKVKYHIESALIFRNMRRILLPGNSSFENNFELLEGLAEYTGIALGIEKEDDRIEYLKNSFKRTLEETKSFVRSFAYLSGPLYGLLLDKSGKTWRSEIPTNTDLGNLISQKYSISTVDPVQAQVDERKNEYGFAEIEKAETAREEENNKVAAVYKKKFLESPALYLPGIKMNYQFNPTEVMSIDDLGNVYPTLRVVDQWGILTVEKGALITSNWKNVIVTAPFTTEGKTLKGDGWNIVLNEGWKAVPYKENSFTLTKEN